MNDNLDSCDDTENNLTQIIKNTVFVSARNQYAIDGILKSGYGVYRPYRDRTIFGRVLREIWFRLHFPEALWYKRAVVNDGPKNIIIQDPLISRKYILWLMANLPESIINFTYCNMVGKARHLYPSQIPEKVKIWTYDSHDANQYNINLYSSGGYCRSFVGGPEDKIYDVVYVGADKGRGEYLLSLQDEFAGNGLKTKFIITADTKISRRKAYYSQPISYEEIVKLDNQSKAILNIVLPNQTGASMRDYESIYNEVKLITNNRHIKNYDFYKEENVFILGEENKWSIKEFINTPFHKIDARILERHNLDGFIKEIIMGQHFDNNN